MATPKHTEPVILIVLTSIVVYTIITRGKKFSYLGHQWRHHIIHPTMKALKMKAVIGKELKRVSAQ